MLLGTAALAAGVGATLLWQRDRETGLDRLADAAQAGDAGHRSAASWQPEAQEATPRLPAPRPAYESGQVVGLRAGMVGEPGLDGC
jgi:hypothetical protein